MNKEKWFAIGAAVVIPLVMLIAFNALVVQPVIGETGAEGRGAGGAIQPAQTFKGVVATNYIDDNGTLNADGAATFGSTVAATGNATFSGSASIAGATTITGVLTLATNIVHSTASITPTNGGILTPTAKLVTLTPAGALGVELGACTTGNETILYNSVNANVVITDTGNGILAGNQTLGQFDALMLSCFASKWVQVSAVSAN